MNVNGKKAFILLSKIGDHFLRKVVWSHVVDREEVEGGVFTYDSLSVKDDFIISKFKENGYAISLLVE